jgi:uncharacterized protein
MNEQPNAEIPRHVEGLYDGPMWESIEAGAMRLQCCRACGNWQYPPGPACPQCLSDDLEWKPVSGRGTVHSWVRFHRQYLPAYPPPHICVSVVLAEGVMMIGNFAEPVAEGALIGRGVRMVYGKPDGKNTLVQFVLEG